MNRIPNRQIAGEWLAEKLDTYRYSHPLVLALPKGGVPVAAAIADRLNGDLDLLIVKKIGTPLQPELAMGAIAEEGEPIWNEDVMGVLGATPEELLPFVNTKRQEILQQSRLWRQSRRPISARDRIVILVDDGLATGSTMAAAIQVLKTRSPKRIIVAVPVGARSSLRDIENSVDHLVVLFEPLDFHSVGQWYEDFAQVSNEEVKEILDAHNYRPPQREEIRIRDGRTELVGELTTPDHSEALVIFAHGSGSTHKSPRNQSVARALQDRNISCLLFDLLSPEESQNRNNIFNIELLAHRLEVATRWAQNHFRGMDPRIGYFGASTGAAAALFAASRSESVFALVSRGGRPDLAMNVLDRVKAPTLLIVGGDDEVVIPLNEAAHERLPHSQLVLIPHAGHLFEEPGAMDQVIEYSVDWFSRHLTLPQSRTGFNYAEKQN